MLKGIFFIFSFSRSGSTVLGQKLNNHSQITVINESGLFTLLGILKWKKLSPLRQRYLIQQCNKNNRLCINNDLVEDKQISVDDFFLSYSKFNKPSHWRKTPTNVFYYDYITKTINNSKCIF